MSELDWLAVHHCLHLHWLCMHDHWWVCCSSAFAANGHQYQLWMCLHTEPRPDLRLSTRMYSLKCFCLRSTGCSMWLLTSRGMLPVAPQTAIKSHVQQSRWYSRLILTLVCSCRNFLGGRHAYQASQSMARTEACSPSLISKSSWKGTGVIKLMKPAGESHTHLVSC